jgi:hypothetical protein
MEKVANWLSSSPKVKITTNRQILKRGQIGAKNK